MSLKVSCPVCSHLFSIKTPKPGKYKPKCTNCSNSFILEIGDGDTPSIKTKCLTESRPPTDKPSLNENKSRESKTIPGFSDTSNTLGATAVVNNEATIDSSIAAASQALPESVPEINKSFLEATVAESAFSFDDNQTVRSNFSSVSKHSKVGPTTSGLDETLDTNLENNDLKNAGFHQTISTFPSKSLTEGVASPVSGADFSFDDKTQETEPKPQANQSNSVSAISQTLSPTNVTVDRLGGYRIVRELGAGGMGSVYLAKQISLDRHCALKTIQAQWSNNPRVIARFIREAYAAAQLTHHNVVQIYDLGQDKGTNFFSMELVNGGSLDDQLRKKGKLPPKLAATLILQAARGLKFAHDHGMVHRDIKPANLMLTSDGLVKVADLGLVKTSVGETETNTSDSDDQALMLASARSQVTQLGSSMGTPSYMSPEQALDSTSVDKRADIYSLGCTFYALLTGKPPFEGKTLMEVLSKHRLEKIVRPERVVSDLPPTLGDIIEKMTAKKPEDRYQDLEEVIEDLEVFLELREDISHAKIRHNKSDRDETDTSHLDEPAEPVAKKLNHIAMPTEFAGQIEIASKRFQKSSLLLARNLAPKAWFGLCGGFCLLSILLALWSFLSLLGEGASSLTSGTTFASNAATLFQSMVSWSKAAFGFALSGVLAPIIAVLLGGVYGLSPLAQRYRESLLAGGVWNWAYWFFATLMALMAVYLLYLWLPFTLAIVIAGAAGSLYWYGIETPLASQRKGALEQAQTVVRQLRWRGTREESIQEAFANQAGVEWEELFEQVFGYSAMRIMRVKQQPNSGLSRKKFRPYRDKLIDRLDAQLLRSKRLKEESVLVAAEKAGLVALGVSVSEAQKKAEAMAASIVDAANETKLTIQELAIGKLTAAAAEAKRQRIKQMLSDARSGKVSDSERRTRTLDSMLGHLLGSKFRFVCSVILLMGVGIWGQANRVPLEQYWQLTKQTVQNASLQDVLSNSDDSLNMVQDQVKKSVAEAANRSWVPVLGGMVNERNVVFVAFAGLLMLVGTLLYGWKISLLFVPLVGLLLYVPQLFS